MNSTILFYAFHFLHVLWYVISTHLLLFVPYLFFQIVSVALFVVVCASAAKLDAPKPIAILRSAQSSNIDGSYSNRYATCSNVIEAVLYCKFNKFVFFAHG